MVQALTNPKTSKLEEFVKSDYYTNLKEERFKDIPRAERRRELKKLDRMEHAIKSLNGTQLELIRIIANEQTKEFTDDFAGMTDRCITAFIINNFEDMTWKQVIDKYQEFSDMVFSETEKVSELKKEFGGNWIMAVNKMEEVVLDRARELIKKGENQKSAVEILALEFNKLSKSMLTNAFKKCKEEYKAYQKELDRATNLTDTDKAVEYIFKEDGQDESKTKKDKLFNGQAVDTNKVVANNASTENKEEKSMNKLKVKSMVVEGENGVYKVCENGVELQGEDLISFSSMDELEKYRKEELEKFENRVSEFREVFKMIG